MAAAQGEQIGIALTDLYPAFSINGDLGWEANRFPDLFKTTAFNGSVGPAFQWNLLNYGRILNNVRLQDAKFQELVVTYQQSVLEADREVEDGLVTFSAIAAANETAGRKRRGRRKGRQDRRAPV